MATTSPDGIVYPSNYSAPADVPNAMQANSNSVQTALNKRAAIIPTSVNISRAAGWQNNFPRAYKMGQMVVLSSHLQRGSTLSVVAQTEYTIGTLPAGYRPAAVERAPCVWVNNGVMHTGGVITLMGDGSIIWTPTASANLAVDDFVSLSGIVFVTP